ncbi:MAG TPA: group III truncated hemoglobin [Burkholderiales bacterium]|nr:group III truncated hemoglobin [Burkholderiales bacterium]
MQDISHLLGPDTVSRVVSDFYDAIQRHPTLSVPFGIVHDWDEHKRHLAHFWWVTLGGKPYRDQPYRVADKHAAAGFTPALLVDWLALFRETLAKHLPEALAEQWYARAANIGRSLEYMHEFRARREALAS